MTQELIEQAEMKILTVDEAQREWYKGQLAKIEKEGPKIIAGIKNKEGAEKATAWRVEVRNFIKSVEEGALGIASSWLNKRKKEIDGEINGYTDPCDKLAKEAKAKTDKWYTAEAQRVKELNDRLQTKAIDKAEEKKEQKVQTLMDLGKHQAAMIEAKRPLQAIIPKIEMPKIKGANGELAVFKKSYVVQIDDLGEVLKHIAKHPAYYALIPTEILRGRLELLAKDLNGNMAEFKGLRCFETVNSDVRGGIK